MREYFEDRLVNFIGGYLILVAAIFMVFMYWLKCKLKDYDNNSDI